MSLYGLTGEIRMNDEIYAGEMPPHKDLKDEEVAAVLTAYVINSGNKVSVITAKEVKFNNKLQEFFKGILPLPLYSRKTTV